MQEIFLFGVCTPYCLLTVFVVCAASASRTFTVFAYQSFGTVQYTDISNQNGMLRLKIQKNKLSNDALLVYYP